MSLNTRAACNTLIALVVLTVMATASRDLKAQVVTSGELVLVDVGGDPEVPDVTIDRITFQVSAGTTVNFDAMCWETPFHPEDDLNGDGEITWTDFQMTLSDAGGNILVRHDDGPRGPDGSISGFDGNFTHTFAAGGMYMLSVGTTLPGFRLFSEEEVARGVRFDFPYPRYSFGSGQDHCDWQVTLTATGGTLSNIAVDTLGVPATPNPVPNQPPEVACAVDTGTLWSPNRELTDVGLEVAISDDGEADPTVDVLVFCNESDRDALGGDAEFDFDTGILSLRAERNGNGSGRVYLLVIVATDVEGASGFDCCTVVVPHDESEAAFDVVVNEALWAEAVCLSDGLPPAGYRTVDAFSAP